MREVNVKKNSLKYFTFTDTSTTSAGPGSSAITEGTNGYYT